MQEKSEGIWIFSTLHMRLYHCHCTQDSWWRHLIPSAAKTSVNEPTLMSRYRFTGHMWARWITSPSCDTLIALLYPSCPVPSCLPHVLLVSLPHFLQKPPLVIVLASSAPGTKDKPTYGPWQLPNERPRSGIRTSVLWGLALVMALPKLPAWPRKRHGVSWILISTRKQMFTPAVSRSRKTLVFRVQVPVPSFTTFMTWSKSQSLWV